MIHSSDLHLEPLHDYGGYAANFQRRFHTDALQQRYNPGLHREISNSPKYLSITTSDYLNPPPFKTGTEGCPNGLITVTRSGFSTAKPLHNPSVVDVLKTNESIISTHPNPKISLNPDGSLPREVLTEVSTSYIRNPFHHPRSAFIYDDPPGCRDSGYSNSTNSFNPVTCKQLDPTMDEAAENLRGRMNIASVTQTDFQPFQILTGKEHNPPLSLTAPRDGSGFITAKELKPCFLPDKVPADMDPCYQHEKYLTIYTQDYVPKIARFDISGKTVVGQKPRTAYSTVDELTLCFRCPISPYLTETMERFVSPVPEGRARHGHLRGAVLPSWNSPFAYNTKLNSGGYVRSCKVDTRNTY